MVMHTVRLPVRGMEHPAHPDAERLWKRQAALDVLDQGRSIRSTSNSWPCSDDALPMCGTDAQTGDMVV